MKRQLFLVLGLALLTLTAGCGGGGNKSVTSSTAGSDPTLTSLATYLSICVMSRRLALFRPA
ncbi:MAG: hypothetical protein PVH64_02650 [Bacillota bacterium]|jgi:ABC-type glycerol-3-phosphate transport system substrate-binding protein